MYLSYEEYLELGGIVPQFAFDDVCFSANQIVKAYTYGRLDAMAELPESVTRLMAKLVDLLYNSRNVMTGEAGAVKSFSTDGYSETYDNPVTTSAVEDIARNWIYFYLIDEVDDTGMPLLYCGNEVSTDASM